MTLRERRLEIMRKVETGEISIENGSRLLAALEAGELLPEPDLYEPLPQAAPAQVESVPMAEAIEVEPEVVETSEEEIRRRVDRWKRWWGLPMGVGVFLAIVAAYWMYAGYRAAGLSWGFWLSWFPFGLGLAIVALSWYSQYIPWLHVRVRDRSAGDVAFSMPLPVDLASWGLRVYRQFAPEQARNQHIEEIESFLSASLFTGDPLHVFVDDKDGSQVEVVILGKA